MKKILILVCDDAVGRHKHMRKAIGDPNADGIIVIDPDIEIHHSLGAMGSEEERKGFSDKFRDARELITHHHYHIAIFDCHLEDYELVLDCPQGTGGITLANQLWERYLTEAAKKSYPPLPPRIIIMTSYRGDNDQLRIIIDEFQEKIQQSYTAEMQLNRQPESLEKIKRWISDVVEDLRKVPQMKILYDARDDSPETSYNEGLIEYSIETSRGAGKRVPVRIKGDSNAGMVLQILVRHSHEPRPLTIDEIAEEMELIVAHDRFKTAEELRESCKRKTSVGLHELRHNQQLDALILDAPGRRIYLDVRVTTSPFPTQPPDK